MLRMGALLEEASICSGFAPLGLMQRVTHRRGP